MTWIDWCATFVSFFVVGLDFSGEMRDATLCQIAFTRLPEPVGKWSAWLIGLEIISSVRQFTLAPAMFIVLGILLIYRGGSSLEIFFNTIAFLFILQIDNLIYCQLLSEETKLEVETLGRVTLDGPARVQLRRVRVSYTSLTMVVPLVIAVLYNVGIPIESHDDLIKGMGLLQWLMPVCASLFVYRPSGALARKFVLSVLLGMFVAFVMINVFFPAAF